MSLSLQSAVAPSAGNGSVYDPILEIKGLQTYFFTERGTVKAVNGVNLTLERQSTLGIVGESGCGKSVMSMSILRLIKEPPGKIVGGEILLHRQSGPPVDLAKVDPRGAQMRSIRGGEIAMIFQEPMTSLNPLYTVGRQISEAVELHQKVGRTEAMDRALTMLERVQISEPKRRLQNYPHQLSGGMRQRVMIAMALSCNPGILIADEPTTALDVTVQAQILDLMGALKADFNSSIMLITHNLGVVSQMADYVAVMYLGKVVEYAKTRKIFHNPLHPYTQGLLTSVPVLGKKAGQLVAIRGMVPSASAQIQGCAFADRCPRVMKVCREETPPLREIEAGQEAACWLY
jgi:peptide/nickel transport system ATP-binding protein/oligopeptide transport system ATP-binding protein